MKCVSVVSGLAVLAASLQIAPASSQSDPVEPLILAAMSAPSTVSYTGIVEVVRIGSHNAEACVYRIEHRAPDLTRRVYTAPSSLAGDSVISQGDESFSIDARRHRIVETRNDAVDDRIAFRRNNSLLRQNYRAIREGAENFDGRPAVDVMLVNKHSRRPSMLMRIDRQTNVVLDQQEFASDGSLVGELRFEAVSYSTAIPASDFRLPKQEAIVRGPTFAQPSEDPDRIARSAGFGAREPHALPDGFVAVEGSLVEMRGVRTLHLLYSDGVRTVSLFENATPSILAMARLQPQPLRVGGLDAQYGEDGATALLAWSDGGLYYALVGDVSLADLARIASSIGR